ncbi:aminoglycoside phosphotransferase family protein [Frondihabitans australicus]|uniref:Aminoglycoside phosphotransferase (APT) family kinase protein n=1 Tax=Frondihabitans australicus TaxID=386892 RepID=A0A495II11_9MICO|nr:aminoglycoside phosphotransferase family protein [Frondihabitans australicus]RKR74941.1 aminoglycoside phosphotransferase (APT) family kinase protein [Frondihabitans australicus]
MAMHDDEVPIDLATASRLIATQFPEWAAEPVRALATDGTVNAIYRVGTGLAARFPLQGVDPAAVRADLENEATAMQELGDTCPFPTPRPVAIGAPGPVYPLPWSVQTWVDGDVATPDGLAGSAPFADDLAALVAALRSADTLGRSFDGKGRGGDLRDSDEWMAVCFAESEGLLPVERLRALWEGLREVPPSGPDVMSHRDLTPANLLVSGGRLVGVIDGGSFGPADPALDLVCAWHLLEAEGRRIMRARLACTDTEWLRGAAWALQQSMGLVWYYRESNPGMSALGRSTLARLLADADLTALTP